MVIGFIMLLCGLTVIALGYITRAQGKSGMWLGAAFALMAITGLLPNAGTGLWATLTVLAAASLVAAFAAMNLRAVPWKRPEFPLMGATFVVAVASSFVKDPDTERALVVLVVVLSVASFALVMRGVVHMLRSVDRASHR